MYKVVDTFNGWQSSKKHLTAKGAEKEIDIGRRKFDQHPGNQNAQYCRAVVPANAEYYWDQRQNKFVWS